MTPKDLGPLAFTAEDFEALMHRLCAHPPHQASTIAEVVNRLLAERLAQAPVVYSCIAWEGYKLVTGNGKPCPNCKPARLVCIEPLRASGEKVEGK